MQFEIAIDKVLYGGSGLGRHEGQVVFVPFSVPGDRLRVRTTERKKHYIRAQIVEIIEPGPGRVPPLCPHFGSCGGCQWQQLEYERQVEAKRRILEEAFHHRFPSTRKLSIEMKASPKSYEYRGRGRLQVRSRDTGPQIGFFQFQSHRVEDVEACPLFRPSLNGALAAVRKSALSGELDPAVEEIEIISSEISHEWRMTTAGAEQAVERQVGECRYMVTPSVFFQANDFMVEELVATVRELVRNSGRETALDLFSGVGLFSLPLAARFGKVTAVESSAEACRLCEMNAAAGGYGNIQVVCADVFAWMKAIGSIAAPAFDLVVLDPPRTGAGQDVMAQLRQWVPESIVYVSCDPQTLCRDIEALPATDYEIDFVQGLDLFPQTYHFETVVRLKRR